MKTPSWKGLFLAWLLVGCAAPESGSMEIVEPEFRWSDLDTLAWAEILAAEDARVESRDVLAPILRGLESRIPEIRVIAVRALGRMESPDLVRDIAPLLTDSSYAVRAEAANALGQAVYRGQAGEALAALVARLGEEPDPYVRGAIAQTLGRLPYESGDTVRLVDAALVGALDDTARVALAGVVKGLESLVRSHGEGGHPSDDALERLRELSRLRSQRSVEDFYTLQIRRLAMAALARSGQVDASFLVGVLVDRDAEVRRLAVGAASSVSDPGRQMDVFTRALSDDDPTVRLAALNAYGRHALVESGCGAVITALDDPDPDVALTAIDILGNGCEPGSTHVQRLTEFVEELDAAGGPGSWAGYPDTWHRPAHALVSLASAAPEQAASYLGRFANHGSWWVRVYAARAAAVVDSAEFLERLASDPHDNVRQAAVEGLSRVVGHEADPVYLRQLSRRDYQLVMTAARALEGTLDRSSAIPALFDALERLTAERRETSRDVRRALLRRIGELGGQSQAVALIPYLRDFDPVIAEETARVLGEWTGRSNAPSPVPLPRLPLPSFGELAELAEQKAVLELQGGGRIVLELFPFEAPTNVARFARLAREGYFDGLTFHRVSRNFVIQGGSPGANEYVGDGPFTRDELTMRSHLRGTVGISTRGRDTGDAQIFVNLADNPRLDHNYTILGRVVEGIDVVDAVLEGAVIERISWQPSGSR